ncbi:MAG: oxygen-independent coproporphyrinogen III oxidase-like protein [Proteobacteria bacterium]|nr:oxygen-independent coproporphyrinogen III oxidase-like protein [Pseudomonadota bacterium]
MRAESFGSDRPPAGDAGTAHVPVAVPIAAPGRPHFRALPPLSLYVHVPWCLKKCPYCDFNSHAVPGDSADSVPEQAYVDALVADLETALPAVWGRRVETIFIGGGTPSLFSPAAIDRLLAAVRARLPVAPGAEVTLEANPGTFERARFAGYYAAGVNRLSLGVQSFDDASLVALGRVHGAAEALRAAEAAMMIFGNVNLDLMFALPGQTVAAALDDVRAALAFAPPHLSFYHLTIEPNTLFHHRPPALPDDDTAADIEEAIVGALSDADYLHYETSAHARRGHVCQHNLNYWRFGDYLGIGAGAHSKLSFPGEVRRQLRWKQPRRYLEQVAAGVPLQEDVAVERATLAFEFMLNALRLADGVPAALFAERTGLPLASVARTIGAAAERGLMEPGPTLLKPTALGRRFLNDLQQMFLP